MNRSGCKDGRPTLTYETITYGKYKCTNSDGVVGKALLYTVETG